MKLSPQRKDGETFKKYQKRRAIENKAVRDFLRQPAPTTSAPRGKSASKGELKNNGLPKRKSPEGIARQRALDRA